jgi:hypothetical protein
MQLLERIFAILSYGGNAPLDVAINYSLLLLNLIACSYTLLLRAKAFPSPRSSSQSGSSMIRATVAALVFIFAFQIVLCLAVGCVGISVVWCALAGWMLLEEGEQERQEEEGSQQRQRPPPEAYGDEPDGQEEEEEEERRSLVRQGQSLLTASALQPGANDAGIGEGVAASCSSVAQRVVPRISRRRMFVVLVALAVDSVAILYYAATFPPITTLAHLCAIGLGAILRCVCGR